jgi:hypothetical protein
VGKIDEMNGRAFGTRLAVFGDAGVLHQQMVDMAVIFQQVGTGEGCGELFITSST